MDFEELTKRISPRLKAISHKLNGRFAFFDEDDLYQEALIHLWQKCENGQLLDKTESYILQACFFFLKNYIRIACKKIDRQSTSLNAIINIDDGIPQEEMIRAKDAEGHFSFIMIDILVDDILNCLSKQEQRVFLLSLDDLTTREIGARLAVSHVMVVKIKKRIREKCRLLKEDICKHRLPK